MNDFNRAFAIIVGVEGGFSGDANDPGNWTGGGIGQGALKGTKFGISAASYPAEDITGLTLERAKAIYERDFWNETRCGELPWPLSLMLFDAAVQHGSRSAIRLLQLSLEIKVDGNFGPATLVAVKSRPVTETTALFGVAREAYYRQLKNFPIYGKGWIKRLFTVALQA